jgi:hypothetical protein
MIKACVYNRRSHPKEDVTLHRILKEPERRQLWLEKLGVPSGVSLSSWTRICSRHFISTDYNSKTLLISSVVQSPNLEADEGINNGCETLLGMI